MKHFRKIWDKEKHDWIFAHKDLNRNESYGLFCKAFPDADVSKIAYFNERSRIGASRCDWVGKHNKTAKPLYSEQIKKGYVRIKIAQPSVWISKAKWVYMETHPWEDFSERSNYIFLDGNSRNFAPDNIERVPLKLMGIFNLLGGTAETPELTRLRIAQAKLKYKTLDAGEELGLVVYNGKYGGRRFKEDRNAKAREYQSRPEVREKRNSTVREYYRRMKTEQPEKWRELQRKHNEYLKAYYKRKREERT